MPLSDIGGLAQGLNQAISQYIGTSINTMQSDYTAQRNLANQKDLMQFEASLKPKAAAIKFGQLKTLNPKLAELGLDDNAEIPLKDLSEFSGLLPKDLQGMWGGGVKKTMNYQEAQSILELMQVPKTVWEKPLADMRKRGQEVPVSIFDDIGKSYFRNGISADTAFKTVSQFMDPADENFWPTVGKTMRESSVRATNPGMIDLTDEELPKALDVAMGEFDKRTQGGMNDGQAFQEVLDMMLEAYKPKSRAKFIKQIETKLTPETPKVEPGMLDKIKQYLRSK